MRFALIDFESESACDLKKAGAWTYSEHPTTNILCIGYSIDGTAAVVRPAEDLQYGKHEHVVGYLEEAAVNPDVIFIAFNCAFEKAIWRNIMVLLYGWPDIPNERWHDVQAVCAMKGLPLKLERVLKVLNMSGQKDTEGTKTTLAYGRTNKRGYYDRNPTKLQRIYDYNRSDISVELDLHRRVRGLGSSERNVWILDQTINERGVWLDMAYVSAAQKICDDAAKPLVEEFRALTGIDKVMSPKFKDWLIAQGCPFPRDAEGKLDTSLSKESVAKLLGGHDDEEESLADSEDDYVSEAPQQELSFAYRRPLEIRKVLGSASIKKLATMQTCCGADGRARGLLQYHGAGPGRWAGRLLQPQNFPRPTLKIVSGFDKDGNELYSGHDTEQLVAAIMTRDAEYVRMMFGEPINAVASGLRHAIIASKDHLLEAGDFSKIECVIVLCLAGAWQTAKRVIEMGSAVYTDMATKIFGYPVNKNMLFEYTVGKNSVLGCGFQMGAPKFHKRYCPDQPFEFAKKGVDEYRERFAPEVPPLWRALQDAATKTVWDRVSYEAYGIQYKLEDGWLTCRLPSGRKLWYYDPKPVRKAMPWDKDDIRPAFEYSSWKMGQWKRVSAYGGLLTENVVQATARDMLVNGMFNCERAGHPIVLTVHDEVINDVPDYMADANLLGQMMCDQPDYIRNLHIPTAAECWVGPRYRK
jgi:DNA polymerase